jgi:hypothetical protein
MKFKKEKEKGTPNLLQSLLLAVEWRVLTGTEFELNYIHSQGQWVSKSCEEIGCLGAAPFLSQGSCLDGRTQFSTQDSVQICDNDLFVILILQWTCLLLVALT